MAISQTHFRSISLPSRLDHSKSLESEFEKLKCRSGSSESLQSGLVALAQLYNSFEEFSRNKSSGVDEDDRKSVEESLARSVDLLDACGAIREVLQMMRENVRVLQSAMRRKGTDSDSAVQNDVAAYFSLRKKMQKTVAKTLKNLRKSEIVNESESKPKSESNNHSINADGEFSFVFKQLAGITSANLKSVLAFVSYAAERSLISRLVAGKSRGGVNEIEDLDLGLRGKMRSDVAKKLQIVDEIIGELEGGLERLFRQFIQTRVTLLNILTHQL